MDSTSNDFLMELKIWKKRYYNWHNVSFSYNKMFPPQYIFFTKNRMNQKIPKSSLSLIKNIDLNEVFDDIKAWKKSSEKIYPSLEHIWKREIKAVILQAARKYKIHIEEIISLWAFLEKIEEISDDIYDLWLTQEVRKILKTSQYTEFEKLYHYVINVSEQHKIDVMESYIKALDNSAIIQIVDKNGIVRYVNDMYRKISWDQRNLVGRKVSAMGGKLYHQNDFWRDLWENLTKGNIWQWVIQNPKMDDKSESYYTFTTITPIKNEVGDILEYITVKFDITKMKKLEHELKQSNQRFHNILNSTNQGFWVIDSELNIRDINTSLCMMLWYTKEELLGKSIRDLLDEKNNVILNAEVTSIQTTLNRKYHIDFTKKDGTFLPVVLKASSLFDKDGKFKEAIAFITDISEIRDYQQKLYEISIKDELTWLWNRRLFDYKIKNYFDKIHNQDSEMKNISIGLFDIDFFKKVNDEFGHDVWDIVLKEFGKRLLHISKENIEVFRVWWEEFAIIGYNMELEEIYNILEAFRKYCQENPIFYEKWKLNFSISWWIAYYDAGTSKEKTPQDLYKEADVWLYAAKNSGKNNIKTKSHM